MASTDFFVATGARSANTSTELIQYNLPDPPKEMVEDINLRAHLQLLKDTPTDEWLPTEVHRLHDYMEERNRQHQWDGDHNVKASTFGLWGTTVLIFAIFGIIGTILYRMRTRWWNPAALMVVQLAHRFGIPIPAPLLPFHSPNTGSQWQAQAQVPPAPPSITAQLLAAQLQQHQMDVDNAAVIARRNGTRY